MILISAFEPFGGRDSNTSMHVAERLERPVVLLPVVFDRAWLRLEEEILRRKPSKVLCLGEAAGRTGCNFERLAINRQYADRGDNLGQKPRGREIVRNAPLALEATWPELGQLEDMASRGWSCQWSFHAGTYVCNDLFYQLLWNQSRYNYLGAFCHVPAEAEPDALAQTLRRFLSEFAT